MPENQLFDYFRGMSGDKCVCIQDSRVLENSGHF